MSVLTRRISVLAVILALTATGLPLSAADPTAAAKTRQAEGTGRVGGTAKDAKGAVLARYRARVRNTTTGQIAGESRTDDRGGFVFTGLNPGTYVVEIVGADGVVVATSASISLTVGAMAATGLTVTASAAGAGTAGAAGSAGAVGAASAGGGFFSSNAGIILLTAAAGAGITGIVIAKQDSSPSR